MAQLRTEQNADMTGIVLSVSVFAAVVFAVSCAGFLLIGCSLAIAAALPHGHPRADRIRQFASRVPGSIWHIACRLDALIFFGAIVAAAVLTVVFS